MSTRARPHRGRPGTHRRSSLRTNAMIAFTIDADGFLVEDSGTCRRVLGLSAGSTEWGGTRPAGSTASTPKRRASRQRSTGWRRRATQSPRAASPRRRAARRWPPWRTPAPARWPGRRRRPHQPAPTTRLRAHRGRTPHVRRRVGGALQVAERLSPAGVRIQCSTVGAREDDDATGQVLLNSFIAGDLARVGRAVARRGIGVGLGGLSGRQRRERALSGRSPHAAGRRRRGRAGSASPRPLARRHRQGTGPESAVRRHQIIAELRTSAGVFAVNGPPH